MDLRIAHDACQAGVSRREQPPVPLRFQREKPYLRAQIREHEAQIARLAHALYLLRLELNETAGACPQL